jgi:glycine cleavage system H protein
MCNILLLTSVTEMSAPKLVKYIRNLECDKAPILKGKIMAEFLETAVDKFIFKVATDRYYNSEGVWAKADGNRVHIGMSDFLQQSSGDVAFAEVKPEGTEIQAGEEAASIETIKVTISIKSPVSGKIIEVNPAMEDAPEVINQDPYGDGWLAGIEANDWEADRANLLDPQAYFTKMKLEAEEGAKKL